MNDINDFRATNGAIKTTTAVLDGSAVAAPTPLRKHVSASVRQLLIDIDVTVVDEPNLYDVVLREMEIPLFREVLAHVDGNQSKAADLLGIHRATLRKKLRIYGLA